MLRPAPDSPPAQVKRAPMVPALSEVEKGSGNEPPPREMLRLSRGFGAEAPIRRYRRTPVVTDGHGAKVCRQMHSVIIRQAPSLRLSPRQDGIQVFGRLRTLAQAARFPSCVVFVLYHERMIAVSLKEPLSVSTDIALPSPSDGNFWRAYGVMKPRPSRQRFFYISDSPLNTAHGCGFSYSAAK